MKKSILMSMLLCSLVFVGNAWSLTVNAGATQVGVLDTLIGHTNLQNSGDDTEIAWVKEVTGEDVTLEVKYNSTQVNWLLTDADDVYALHLLGLPKYFLIKTGNVVGPDDTFLFLNNTELEWAVVSVGADIVAVDMIEKVSHLDEFNNTPVPEPGTVLLLGAGFLGLAIYGKRRRNA